MIIKIIQYSLLLSVLFLFIGCEKLNLERDGYLICEVEKGKVIFDKLYFMYSENTNSTIHKADVITKIDEYSRGIKKNSGVSRINMFFPAYEVESWNVYNPEAHYDLILSIIYIDNVYSFPRINSNGEQISELSLTINKFEKGKKKVKGIFSGKLWDEDCEKFILVEDGKFTAMLEGEY